MSHPMDRDTQQYLDYVALRLPSLAAYLARVQLAGIAIVLCYEAE